MPYFDIIWSKFYSLQHFLFIWFEILFIILFRTYSDLRIIIPNPIYWEHAICYIYASTFWKSIAWGEPSTWSAWQVWVAYKESRLFAKPTVISRKCVQSGFNVRFYAALSFKDFDLSLPSLVRRSDRALLHAVALRAA